MELLTIPELEGLTPNDLKLTMPAYMQEWMKNKRAGWKKAWAYCHEPLFFH